MIKPTLKFAAVMMTGIALTAGSAMAGNGKDCKHKKTTDVTSETMATPMTETAVLGATASKKTHAKKQAKTYTAEEARALCTKHKAKDLDACIAYKTKKVKPKS